MASLVTRLHQAPADTEVIAAADTPTPPPDSDVDSGAITGTFGTGLRASIREDTGVHVRLPGQVVADYMHVEIAHTSMEAGDIVNENNIKVDMMVVRSPAWTFGDKDGGTNQPGRVVAWSKAKQTATVHWAMSGQTFTCGIGDKSELCVGLAVPEPRGPRRNSVVGKARAALKACFRPKVDVMGPGAFQLSMPKAFMPEAERPRACRNSQNEFDQAHQTCIIFDWDDTLFPTTYLREDLGFSLRLPLDCQRASSKTKAKARETLALAATHAGKLLRFASTQGRVILVTLAKDPWVTDACAYFFPGVGELIKELGVEVVYAQTGVQVDYSKVSMMKNADFAKYWSGLKGEAITKVLNAFYSQYEGQSWKNIISIGDSCFERCGTINATMEYANSRGIDVLRERNKDPHRENSNRTLAGEVKGQEFKIRTKTIKLMDEPSAEEVILQLGLLEKWLTDLVSLDDGCDIDINTLKNVEHLARIEAQLKR